MTVEQLLGSLTHQEWVEWQVFASTEPIGGRRSDVQAAQVAYSVFAAAPRRKGAQRPQFSRFLPDYWRAAREATPSAMLGFAAALTRRLGGQVGPKAQEALHGERRDADSDAGP